MIDMLQSLKKDLLNGRLLPILVLLGVAVVGAVAYALLGGGGSSASSSVASTPVLPPPPTTVASPAPANPKVAVSETTDGSSYQRGGATRDPFVPLPEKRKPGTTATAASGTSSSAGTGGGSSKSAGTGGSSTSGAGSTGGGSGASGGAGTGGGSRPGSSGAGGATETTPTPTPKPKKRPTFEVALLFGLAPPVGQNPQLTPYENLRHVTPLPSKQNPLLVLTAVGPGGKGAIFKLLQPAILKGKGTCMPSSSQCESIDLPVGQTEELSYTGETGQSLTYLLQVVSIAPVESSARSARVARAKGFAFLVEASASPARGPASPARGPASPARGPASPARGPNRLGADGAAHDHRGRVARARPDLHR
jgi:hypothetical protein